MKYTKEMCESISEEAKGKTIQSLELVEDSSTVDDYWVMTFTDESEISFRFMAELVNP